MRFFRPKSKACSILPGMSTRARSRRLDDNPYLDRATEIRIIAEPLKDLECRAMLFRLADSYAQMARAAADDTTFKMH
jgi:hypothetical protein